MIPLKIETLYDGGAWRSDAMRNIKDFMETQVEGLSVIA